MKKLLLLLMCVSSSAWAQGTTGTIPGGGGAGNFVPIPSSGSGANKIVARNAGNTDWVFTTNTSGGAPTNSGYWLSAADAGLTSGKDLSQLTTALVLNTSGTPSAYAGSNCAANRFSTSMSGIGALTCAQVDLTAAVTGVLPQANGGGLTTFTADGVAIANGSAFGLKIIPDCPDASGKHLNYATGGNFTCGTSTSGGLGTGNVTGPATTTLDNSVMVSNGTNGRDLKQLSSFGGDGVPIYSVSSGKYYTANVYALSGNGNTIVTGSGASLFQPNILDFSNSIHDHSSNTFGGQLDAGTAFNQGTLSTLRGGTGSSASGPTGTGKPVLQTGPSLTGNPSAPTAATGDNTGSIATTAFVQGEFGVASRITTANMATPGSSGDTSCTFCSITKNNKGQVLAIASGSPVVPGGATTNVQYNDTGTLSGDSGLTYNKTTHELTATGGFITPPNSTAGQKLRLCEDTDLGASCWSLDIGAINLAADFSISPGTDGKLSGATLLRAADETKSQCIYLSNLSAAATPYIMAVPNDSTLVKAWCIANAAATPATVHITECNSSGASCNRNTTSTMSCGTTGASTTTFGGAGGTSLLADEWVAAEITNTPTATGVTTICVSWTPN